MRAVYVLLLVMLSLSLLGASHASANYTLSLPAGADPSITAFVNITNVITQVDGTKSTSTVEYTFVYGGSSTINLTVPSKVYDVQLLLNGAPYAFSETNDVQCSIFVPLNQESCDLIDIKGVLPNDIFELSYSYTTTYSPGQSVFNSTFEFIPFAPTQLMVVTELPTSAFLQTNPYYSPPKANFSSNGQNIEVVWSFYQLTTGLVIPFNVSYALTFPSQPFSNTNSYIIAGIVIVGIVIALFLLWRYRETPATVKGSSRKKTNPFFALLSADEKKVLGLLRKGAFTGQKELITLSGFSKVKISKIISKLSRYKLVKIKYEGKYNKIKRI